MLTLLLSQDKKLLSKIYLSNGRVSLQFRDFSIGGEKSYRSKER
jgi:hypothetical protein